MKLSHNIGELKVIYRTTAIPRCRINSSLDTARFLKEIWDHEIIEYIEQFCLVLLNRSNMVMAYDFLSTGGTAGTIVDPKLVFQTALLANASSIILAHNHPSGNLSPSEQDKRLTSRLFEIGKALDIPVLDHIIVTKDSYTSLADQGLIN